MRSSHPVFYFAAEPEATSGAGGMNLVNINRGALSSFDAYSFNVRCGRRQRGVDELSAGIEIDLAAFAQHPRGHLLPRASCLQRRLPPRKVELYFAGGGDGQASVRFFDDALQHRVAEEIHVFGPSSRGRLVLDRMAEAMLSRGTAGRKVSFVVAKGHGTTD